MNTYNYMLGNIINSKIGPVEIDKLTVSTIGIDPVLDFPRYIEPIRITGPLLIALGFTSLEKSLNDPAYEGFYELEKGRKTYTYSQCIYNSSDPTDFALALCPDIGVDAIDFGLLNYLHEFQNLYRILAGEEFPINIDVLRTVIAPTKAPKI